MASPQQNRRRRGVAAGPYPGRAATERAVSAAGRTLPVPRFLPPHIVFTCAPGRRALPKYRLPLTHKACISPPLECGAAAEPPLRAHSHEERKTSREKFEGFCYAIEEEERAARIHPAGKALQSLGGGCCCCRPLLVGRDRAPAGEVEGGIELGALALPVLQVEVHLLLGPEVPCGLGPCKAVPAGTERVAVRCPRRNET